MMTCLSRENYVVLNRSFPATGGHFNVGHDISAEDTYPRKCLIQHFLGFAFICGKTRRGKFLPKRRSRRDRMKAKLKEIGGELRRRMHQPIPQQAAWLKQVIAGYFGYHAVPTNGAALNAFRDEIIRRWRRLLSRRSQKGGLTWARMKKLADDRLPKPRILHPWPRQRFAVKHPR
jgi:RNA-directed DNA polymerase